MHNIQFFISLSIIWKTFCIALLAIYVLSESKYQLVIYAILHSNIKSFFSANLLNAVVEIFTVTLDTVFTYEFFEFEKVLCNSPKIVPCRKYIKNVQIKTLKLHCPNDHIFMFRSFSLAAAQIEMISWLVLPCITTTDKHWEEHDLILYFHFLLSCRKRFF